SFSVDNLFAILFLLVVSSGAIAQSGGGTDLALAKGRSLGSHQISDIENINYFNGRINITIPLANVNGRGSVAFPINAIISSPGWKIQVGTLDDGTGTGGRVPAAFADIDPVGEVSGRISLEKRMFIGFSDPSHCDGAPYFGGLTRLYVTMPDGT